MNLPIGIFDSGLGGLSVVRELSRLLPYERIVYFADSAHVPYGERPFEEVKKFACGITKFLVKQKVKAIVMACNISSALALQSAQTLYSDIPIIGVIQPGARVAHRVSKGRPIGVLATSGTVNSGAYQIHLKDIDPSCCVVQQACPEFVPLIEKGLAESEYAQSVADKYVKEIVDSNCGTVVLGCTHYPFVKHAISKAVGQDMILVDPAEETVRELADILSERKLVAKQRSGENIFYTSGDTQIFAEQGTHFLNIDKITVCNAVWKSGVLELDF